MPDDVREGDLFPAEMRRKKTGISLEYQKHG